MAGITLAEGAAAATPSAGQSVIYVKADGLVYAKDDAGVETLLSNVVADHGTLTGLGDDDHTQYALLAGRATGQILTGGTASGDDLTLRSTSNATKGDINLADQGGHVQIGGGATASELRMFEPSGGGASYVAFKAPALAANVTYTLPVDDGAADEVLKTDGSGGLDWVPQSGGGLTLGTPVASTSGTEIDFTGIPAGTKQIIVSFVGVSTVGAGANLRVQLGDAGGLENTGYSGQTLNHLGNSGPALSAGFDITELADSSVVHGHLDLILVDAATFTWVGTWILGHSNSAVVYHGGGSKSLSAELTQIRITTANGTDTLDAGKVNIATS